MTDREKFLTTFFRGIPDDRVFYLWLYHRYRWTCKCGHKFVKQFAKVCPKCKAKKASLKNHKETLWCASVDDALQKMQEYEVKVKKAGTEFYVSMGLQRKIGSTYTRATDAEVCGVTGMWLDIDVECDAHKTKNLPKNKAEAQSILNSVGLDPTMVINSGHGYHIYWMLTKPYIWDNGVPEQHAKASALVKNWYNYCRDTGKTLGFHLDPVGDLCRVLRLPGTWNFKRPEVVPVEVVMCTSAIRYAQKDFVRENIDPGFVPKNPDVIFTLDFKIDCNADPPKKKFEALCMNKRRFKQTWETNRPDLSDQSVSSYEMSLANAVVRAEWTSQEIVDLLVAYRRGRNGVDDEKMQRHDYYEKTLRAAHRNNSRRSPDDGKDEPAQPEPEIPDDPEAALVLLRELLGLRITGWVSFIGPGNEAEGYRIELEGDEFIRISMTGMSTAGALAQQCLPFGYTIKPLKRGQLLRLIYPLVTKILVKKNISQDIIAGELRVYLDQTTLIPADKNEAYIHFTSKRPFLRGGRIIFSPTGFRTYLKDEAGVDLSVSTIAHTLEAVGCEREVVTIKTLQRVMYAAPLSMIDASKVPQNLPDDDVDEIILKKGKES